VNGPRSFSRSALFGRLKWGAGVILAGLVVLAALGSLLKSDKPNPKSSMERAHPLDLSGYSDAAPGRPLHLLFIHHSCGGQLLATPGPATGTNCIHPNHPNGGGLRVQLETNGYVVHEASYGSRIGKKTDIFDWLPKFRTQMEQILTCDTQDVVRTDGGRNEIVVFKSCFPNNAFEAEGTPPGNPEGPNLTVWNAKAAYTALLAEFRKQPQVLFVCVTAPPLAPHSAPLWKRVAKRLLGRSSTSDPRLARQFNNWLSDQEGWLKDSGLTNVVVFDYYDILTDHGVSDLSCYPTGGGCDSHPSRAGNERAAAAFVPLLNRAARRAGLTP